MCRCDAGEYTLDPTHIFSLELAVAEIDLMNNFRDLRERRILELKSAQQRFEGAAIALVRVLRLEHVEPELTRFRLVSLWRDELEVRLWIDEPANVPSVCNAGHKDSFT